MYPVGGVGLGFAHGALVFPLAPHTRFPFIFRLADWDVLPLLEEVPELRRRSALRGVSVDGANLTATAPHRLGVSSPVPVAPIAAAGVAVLH